MIRSALLASALLSATCQLRAAPPELIALPAGFVPLNISDDGRTVVGHSTGAAVPMIWSESTGVEQIMAPSGEPAYGKCYATSDNGAVVVGTIIVNGLQTPFRWSRDQGTQLLNPEARGNAYDCSGDGTVVVGDAGSTDDAPGFLWQNGVFSDLLAPPPHQGGTVSCVSGDGLVATGVASGGSTGTFVRWDIGTNSSEALSLESGEYVPLLGFVNDMNAEGSVLVGIAHDGQTGVRPILWSSNAHRFLGIPGAIARRCSRDARFVAGATAANGGSAWVASLAVEPTDLRTYLHDHFGYDCPSGDTYTQVLGVSGDGRTLCGWGAPSNWLLKLPAELHGDFNLDETSDYFDILDYLDCFEGIGLLPPSAADLNHDGITDFFDLDLFLGQ